MPARFSIRKDLITAHRRWRQYSQSPFVRSFSFAGGYFANDVRGAKQWATVKGRARRRFPGIHKEMKRVLWPHYRRRKISKKHTKGSSLEIGNSVGEELLQYLQDHNKGIHKRVRSKYVRALLDWLFAKGHRVAAVEIPVFVEQQLGDEKITAITQLDLVYETKKGEFVVAEIKTGPMGRARKQKMRLVGLPVNKLNCAAVQAMLGARGAFAGGLKIKRCTVLQIAESRKKGVKVTEHSLPKELK